MTFRLASAVRTLNHPAVEISLALVGIKGYGGRHVTQFADFEKQGLVRVRALADPSEEALNEQAACFRKPALHTDYLRMLDEEKLDAVVFSTPIPLHDEMAREALARGLHVLVEKPAVPLMSQLEGLIAADPAQRTAVAFQRISAPRTQALKHLVCEGALGRLISLSVTAVWPRATAYYQRASWAGELFWKDRPVLDGPATNALSHWINSIMFLAGETPETFAVPEALFGECYRARNISSYDTACLGGRFANGVKFFAGFSHASATVVSARLRVEGDKGVAWMDEDGTVRSDDIAIPACEPVEDDLIMSRHFLDGITGKAPRQDVRLTDVRGYTLATNLMLQASRGIHALECGIPSGSDDPAKDYVVIPDIGDHLKRAAAAFSPLREIGAPWAVSCDFLKSGQFDEATMLGFLQPS